MQNYFKHISSSFFNLKNIKITFLRVNDTIVTMVIVRFCLKPFYQLVKPESWFWDPLNILNQDSSCKLCCLG